METQIHKHESFGQISFIRTTGTADFYGSELTQDHYISMELHNSQVYRSLTDDRYMPTGPILVRVRMTAGQFSEMITSMNTGSGVCCTIERFAGKKVEELPSQQSRKEYVHIEFRDRMKAFGEKLHANKKKASEIIKKKILSKQDIQELSWFLEHMTQEIESSIPFLVECFQESMDKVVLEAKTEVENAIQHKINTLGLNALHEQNKLLSEGN